MIKRFRYQVFAVCAFFLAASAYLYLNYANVLTEPQVHEWQAPVGYVAGDEPITPIPLSVKLDKAKVALGRRLFNDLRLSGDGTISCAHCHKLEAGGDDDLPRSVGINGELGNINAPTVFNSAYNFRQFWDGRAATLEEQIDGPVQNPSEMGANWPDVIATLEQDERYRKDFAALYESGIARDTIKDAIATFERSLSTPNARFDRFLRGEKNALDGDEFAGYQLFKDLGCITCHQGMNVGGNMYEKLGLVADYYLHRGDVQKVDLGRYNLTGIEENRYEFRVPSLRNVAQTSPYFHDGSADTLEHAVAIMGKYQLGVDLQDVEISRIVKFLETLTGEYPAALDEGAAK